MRTVLPGLMQLRGSVLLRGRRLTAYAFSWGLNPILKATNWIGNLSEGLHVKTKRELKRDASFRFFARRAFFPLRGRDCGSYPYLLFSRFSFSAFVCQKLQLFDSLRCWCGGAFSDCSVLPAFEGKPNGFGWVATTSQASTLFQ